jgi:hypothetical protein
MPSILDRDDAGGDLASVGLEKTLVLELHSGVQALEGRRPLVVVDPSEMLAL